MNPRTTLCLAIAAGLAAPAAAQEVMVVHHTWFEVNANSTVPVAAPNSVVEPGEGVRMRLGVTAQINGSNAVGQTVNYVNPAPGGVGTVRGLGSVVYDLVGDARGVTANGTWRSILGPTGSYWAVSNGGPIVDPGGASVSGIAATQFVGPGGSINGSNNNETIFRGTWTPDSYAARTVRFAFEGSRFASPGSYSSINLAYGYASDFAPIGGAPFVYDLIVRKSIASEFGVGAVIPVVPASSTGLAALALVRPASRRPARHLTASNRTRHPFS